MRRLLIPFLAALVAAPALVGVPAAGAGDFDYGFAEFRATCPASHRAHDDPIVFPAMPGMSHSHEFFGSEQTNAHTTTRKLRKKPTTCAPDSDKSAYWVPSLYENDVRVRIKKATFYYSTFEDWTGPRVESFPRGLRVIAGSAKATGPYANPPYVWSCLGSTESSTEEFPQCPSGSDLELLLNFPECWDGVNKVDPVDHKSHMAFRVAGECPVTHPVPVPRLQFKLRYDADGGSDTTLASMIDGVHGKDAAAYTAHGDFWNAWGREALQHRIDFCLVAQQFKCDENAAPDLG